MLTGDLDLRTNVERVTDRVARAARRAGRDPASVTLVAVTKTHPASHALAALRAGVTHLGENRVQEAAEKIPELDRLIAEAGMERPCWHLIGHLQTNKAKLAAALFETVESVDSPRIAEELSRRAALSSPPRVPLPVLLEVYVGDDPARPGFRPTDLEEALPALGGLPGLHVEGLMTVAPLGWSPEQTRGAFRQVRALRDRLAASYPRVDLHQLSMGMSDDFELAVEEGSTVVRVGRAIFGPRETG